MGVLGRSEVGSTRERVCTKLVRFRVSNFRISVRGISNVNFSTGISEF